MYRKKCRPRATLLVLLFLSALLQTAQIHASQGGRVGFSGNPATNAGAVCRVCHAPDGAETPTVLISGPQVIDAGTTQNYTVTITGGPAQTAGVDISAGNGVGDLLPNGADLQQLQGELTHTGPKSFSGNAVSFEFQYTAPHYDTVVTLYAAGNSTNGGLNLQGDGISSTSLDINVENGFEEPPEPPEPPTGQMTPALVASGLNSPVVIANAGDGRLFVVERGGIIRIIDENGELLPQPYLNISSQVNDRGGEMGMLGLAFHPNYANNGWFYVYYTPQTESGDLRSRVSRFRVRQTNPQLAGANTERVVMEFDQTFINHNAGDMHFGPDGYLYIASGDGGPGGDPNNNAQNTTTLLGKILRVDVNPQGSGSQRDCYSAGNVEYRIPPGNAFKDGPGGAGCDEIFALGVRNPWRFAFDSLTGDMWIADVGQSNREEVSRLPPGVSGGLNLGWRCYEGKTAYNLADCTVDYFPPVYEYTRDEGCSITGGRVYRGEATTLFQGEYFFTDFCQSSIRTLSGPPGNLTMRVVVPEGELSSVSTFGEDVDGELYVAEIYTGDIFRLDPQTPPPGC
ncbi:MAG: PQQ-dependent sugar dehydrogenase [Halioglobus sp.]|nr:PQQ-dependent sugar dehydrogenase [Halioglobus sp.]